MKRLKKFFAATIAAVLTVSSAPGLETPISKLLEKSMSVNADDSTPVAPAAPFFAETRYGGFKLNADGTIMDGGVVSLNDNFEYDSATKTLKINNIEFCNSTISEIKTEYVLDTSAVKGLTIEFDGECKITSKPKEDQTPGCLKVADGTTIKCTEGTKLRIKAKDKCNAIESEGSLNITDASIYACDTSDSYPQNPITANGDITITNSDITATSITSTTKITADNAIMYGAGKIKFGDNDEEWQSGTTKSITNEQINAKNIYEKVFYFNNCDVRNFGLSYRGDERFVVQYGDLNSTVGTTIQTPVPGIEIQTKENGDKKLVLDNCTFENKNEEGGVLFITNWKNAEIEVKGKNRLISSQVVISGSDIKFTGIGSDASLCLDSANTLCMYAPSITFENLDITAYKRLDDYPAIISGTITAKHAVVENGAEKFVSGTSTSIDAKEVGKSVTLHAGTAPYCVSSNVKIGKSNDKYYGVYLDVNFFIPDYDADDANKVFGASVNGGNCVTFTNSDDSEANCRAIIKDVAPKDMANPIEITYNSMNRTPVIYDKNGDKADFCMASVLADIFYNTNADWKEKEFAKAMILYGSRAQTYFKTNTDSLASRYLNSGDVSWTSEATAKSGVNSYTDKITGYSEYIGQTLLLNNTAGIKTYTTDAFKGFFNIYDTIGKRDFSLSQNAEEINGITPDYFGYNLEGRFTVNGVNVDTCHLCVYDYVYTILNGKDYDQELKDLCCEIYNVGMTAKSFTGVEY